MPNPVWREVFLEIALRALKKVHVSHTPWALKRNPVRFDELSRLNNSPAIFHALETTVASEISNEFIYSSYTNGMNIIADGDEDPQPRYFEVHREINFSSNVPKEKFYDKSGGQSQDSKTVDLILRRREEGGRYIYEPSLIELKRYYKTEIDIGSGIAEFQLYKTRTDKKDNFNDIVRDAKNLISLKNYWLGKTGVNNNLKNNTNKVEFIQPPDKQPFLYILTWGFWINEEENVAELLKKRFEIHFDNVATTDFHMKWMPVSTVEIENKPNVNEWLWLALIEITNYQIKRVVTKSTKTKNSKKKKAAKTLF